MLNVYELEKRWFKYKTRSLLPIISFIIILLIVVGVIFLNIDLKKSDIINVSSFDEVTLNTHKEEKNIPNIPIEEPHKFIHDETPEIKTVQITETKPTPIQKSTVLEPSLGFMKKMQTETTLQYHEKIQDKLPIQNAKKQEIVIQEQEHKPEAVVQKKVLEDTHVIKIKKQNTYEDIDYVLKRFKKNNNPALSLFIAKKYYELGDYKQAYNYALVTNKINNNIEASWIIFSKSLVKLKKKKKAIKTLQQYINHSGSNQARLLLEDILSGKFQ